MYQFSLFWNGGAKKKKKSLTFFKKKYRSWNKNNPHFKTYLFYKLAFFCLVYESETVSPPFFVDGPERNLNHSDNSLCSVSFKCHL